MTCPSILSLGLVLILLGHNAAVNHVKHQPTEVEFSVCFSCGLPPPYPPLRLPSQILPCSPKYSKSPEPDLRSHPGHPSACQEHMNLHTRLDVVEKKVEATIDTLEAELGILLNAIDAPEWRPLLDFTGKATVDILEDPEQRGKS